MENERMFSNLQGLADRFGQLFNNEIGSDVTLCVFDEEAGVSIPGRPPLRIHAHRALLSVTSEPFRAMFTGDFAESRTKEVQIREVSADAFRKLIEYVYTGRILLTSDDVMAVLAVSNRFDVPEVKSHCEAYIEESIDKDNVCSLLEAAKLHDSEELRRRCEDVLLDAASEVLATDEIFHIKESTWLELLQNDRLAADEIDIFRALIRWGKHVAQGRSLEDVLAKLLPHVRYVLIQPKQLRNYVAELHVVPEKLLLDAALYLLAPHENEMGSTARTKPRIHCAVQKGFKFDPDRKGSGLILSNQGSTLIGRDGRNFHTVLGTQSFSKGRSFWEVTIDSSAGDGHVRLGIALETANLETYLGAGDQTKMIGWHQSGYIEGMFDGGQKSNGFGKFIVGDVVGLLLDLNTCVLSFYVNKVETGQLSIPRAKYYPAFCVHTGQITLLPPSPIPV
jgi:hypothetical protein